MHTDPHRNNRAAAVFFTLSSTFCKTDFLVDDNIRTHTAPRTSRMLFLRKIRTQQLDDEEYFVVQAIVESTTRDAAVLNALAEELRALPCAKSVDWIETEGEAE